MDVKIYFACMLFAIANVKQLIFLSTIANLHDAYGKYIVVPILEREKKDWFLT